MAIRYFCDHCGQPALTRQPSKTQHAYGAVSVPKIEYKGSTLEIIIVKDYAGELNGDRPRREDLFGDICMDCLIDAVRHGEIDNGN